MEGHDHHFQHGGLLRRRVHPVPDRDGHRRLGSEQDCRLGLGHHQLRVVGRHRPRRHADFRRVVAVPSEVADGHQPLCGGDDHFRGHHGGSLPRHPHGPHLGELLGASAPEPVWVPLGQLQQPALVGRVRHLDLLLGVPCLLVHRPHSGLRDNPRPDDQAAAEEDLQHPELRMEWPRQETGPASRR